MNREIKLIISDFDGTLVDTREANYLAYREVLSGIGYDLGPGKYNECFGLRFEEFMSRLGILDQGLMEEIRAGKAKAYPNYFHKIKLNRNLAGFIEVFRSGGGNAALASTASRLNMLNVLAFIGLSGLFDFIVSGDDTERPKPNPECYIKAMRQFNVLPSECLIFEDAPIGIEAASASGACFIVVKEFCHGN